MGIVEKNRLSHKDRSSGTKDPKECGSKRTGFLAGRSIDRPRDWPDNNTVAQTFPLQRSTSSPKHFMEKIKSRACQLCKSETLYTTVEYPYWHDDVLVALVKNVPSHVCRLCGQRYFDPNVEFTLHELVRDYIKLGKTFPIPTTPYRAVTSHAN